MCWKLAETPTTNEQRLNQLKYPACPNQLQIFYEHLELRWIRITFRDCGKGKSVTQMVDYKNNAIEYLEGVLTNVEDYLTATKFKK